MGALGGTIEYTFMAPLSRAMHLGPDRVSSPYSCSSIRAILLFIVVAAFFGLQFDDTNFVAALVILVVASVSFFGIETVAAVLPLISPERARSSGFVAQGCCSSSRVSTTRSTSCRSECSETPRSRPRRTALEGIRAAILDGAGVLELRSIWPLLIIGAACIPLGLWIFSRGSVRSGTASSAVRMIDIRTAEDRETDAYVAVWVRSPRTSPRTPPSNANGASATGGGCISSPSAAARSSAAGSRGHRSRRPKVLSPQVLPGARRAGVGTALLHEARLPSDRARLRPPRARRRERRGLARVRPRRFRGFEEVDRQVEQVLVVGHRGPAPDPPDSLHV